jgi:hypothetical protein
MTSRRTGQPDASSKTEAGERDGVGNRRRCDIRRTGKLVEQPQRRVGRQPPLGGRRRICAERGDVARRESGIDRGQPEEAADDQRGCDEHDHAERHLGGDEHVCDAPP